MSQHFELPDKKQLQEARDRFSALLHQSKTKEAAWQKLFSDCPYILSQALPLKLSPRDIHPLARPGRSEPDFIFFPHRRMDFTAFGAIELKTPDSKILATPRKDIITLSRSASTAIQQALVYKEKFDKSLIKPDEILFIGNPFFVFVIMGVSKELAGKLHSDFVRNQLANLLPEQCRIIPYDTLYRLFAQTVPPSVFYLVPASEDLEDVVADAEKLGEELFEAVNSQKFERALRLIDVGADVNFKDQRNDMQGGGTPLHWATLYGNVGLVRRLLDEGAYVNATDNMGRTPLFPAAANGHVEVVRLLLEHGADIQALNYLGWRLIPRQRRHSEVVSLLTEYGYHDELFTPPDKNPYS